MPQPKEQKREAAKLRQAEYDKLTAEEKIRRLDLAFGEGQGAKRERERIRAWVEKQKAKKAEKVVEKEGALVPGDLTIIVTPTKKAKKNGKGK